MSNIFKRLLMFGRREEREDVHVNLNHGAETHQQNIHQPNETEHPLEENHDNTRGQFCHQRPRYRRGARKRLCFPSKHDDEPPISCCKTSREDIPHTSCTEVRGNDVESCDAVLLKDDIAENEVGGTEANVLSADDVGPKSSADGVNHMNESFEVLMPDLMCSNGNDLSTKKVTKRCNEATPDPPVLDRMDTGPRPHSLSKEDVDLPVKSPVTRSQSRKGEFQLLKLLYSDDDTTQNAPLPLLSLSKAKKSPAYFDLSPLKVKAVGEESLSKNGGQIERNNLNIPLGESNIRNATIPLLLSRSFRRRKQMECGKTNECNDASVTVLVSQRVDEDLNKTTARNTIEKERSEPDKESDKENNEPVGSDKAKEVSTDGVQCKEVDQSEEDIKEPNCQISESAASAENETKSDDGDVICLEDVAVRGADVKDMQLEKGNGGREPNCKKFMESTESAEGDEMMNLESTDHSESTEVANGSSVGGDESQTGSNELQGGDINDLKHKEGLNSRKGNVEPSSQEFAEPTKSPKVDKVPEEMDKESAETSAIEKVSVDGKQCKEESDDRDDTKEVNSQESAGPSELVKVKTTSVGGGKEFVEIRQPEDIIEMQCNEESSAEVTKDPIVQESSKTTETFDVEKGSERVDRESQKDSINVFKEVSADEMYCEEENKGRDEPSSHNVTEPMKSTMFENHLNGGVTFHYTASLLSGPQGAPISSDLSPTITPRETYEMFAAPNSHGKFNGRWPMAEGSMSHLATAGRRGRKRKTERRQKTKAFDSRNIDAYNMPRNTLDWCGMMSAQVSYYSHEDEIFAMTGAVPQGRPQESSDTGGYYGSMMSSSEQIPFRSSDDLVVARAASSDSGIDSQGAGGELESDTSGSKTKKGNEDQRNDTNYKDQEQVDPRYNDQFFQPQFDGLYMIDSRGCCIPVNPNGTMIPPPGFQGGPYGPYGYPGPINGQYYPNPNQNSRSRTNVRTDEKATSCSDEKQKDNDYQFMLESSRSVLKDSAGGDEGSFDKTNEQAIQEMQDTYDALRILLQDAFDPSVPDPGDLLATYGAELLKDEELRLEFIYFCQQLLNYKIMMGQSGGYFPGACGDFAYQYPTPYNPAMWPPPAHYPHGWYPNDVAYYYDGESYIPTRVRPDPQGNMCMVLPDGHPDQYGPRDYQPIYAGPDGLCVSIDSFVEAGVKHNQEQSPFTEMKTL